MSSIAADLIAMQTVPPSSLDSITLDPVLRRRNVATLATGIAVGWGADKKGRSAASAARTGSITRGDKPVWRNLWRTPSLRAYGLRLWVPSEKGQGEPT
jgi:hypothetical protein